jgi:Ca2+-binding RTX toxin-like protein
MGSRWSAVGVTVIAVGLALAVPALAEVVRGTPEADRLVGGKKSDTVSGRGGDDRLNGKAGLDLVKGGPGDDVVIGGSGFDQLRGDAGDDVIRARDGESDQIECGPGVDRAVVDAVEDGVFDCEEVFEP